MNSTEKDNIVDKAMCCSGTLAKKVADMYLTGSRCADKEFQKLFLLISYTEALGCYQASLEETTYTVVAGVPVPSVWSLVVPCVAWETVLTISDSASLTIDGVQTDLPGDGTITFGEALESLLDSAGFTYTVGSCVGDNITISITAECDTEAIVATFSTTGGPPPVIISTDYTATLTETGNCTGDTLVATTTTTEYTNCLTEDQADDIATQISKICDLCDEH